MLKLLVAGSLCIPGRFYLISQGSKHTSFSSSPIRFLSIRFAEYSCMNFFLFLIGSFDRSIAAPDCSIASPKKYYTMFIKTGITFATDFGIYSCEPFSKNSFREALVLTILLVLLATFC
jgi:hypothetical protein